MFRKEIKTLNYFKKVEVCRMIIKSTLVNTSKMSKYYHFDCHLIRRILFKVYCSNLN